MQARFAIKIRSPTTDVGRQFRWGAIRKHPQDVGPQSAIARRMRIAILVAERMMLAMIRHQRSAEPSPDTPPSHANSILTGCDVAKLPCVSSRW